VLFSSNSWVFVSLLLKSDLEEWCPCQIRKASKWCCLCS
jgi:hypothetical protein